MDFSELRKEFSIVIVEETSSHLDSLVESLKAVGYTDVRTFSHPEEAIEKMQNGPPHLVLFDYDRGEALAERFLRELVSLSREIIPLLMIQSSQILSALQLIGRNLAYDSIVRPFVSTLELIQKLDRAASRLIYQFESEQLREELETYKKQGHDGAHSTIDQALAPRGSDQGRYESSGEGGEVFSGINDFLSRLAVVKDLEQTNQIYMEALSASCGNIPILYFKYVASHMTLVVSQSANLPVDKMRGIGVDLKKEDPMKLPQLLLEPSQIESLRHLVTQVFRRESFVAFPHSVDGEIAGVFVALGKADLQDSTGVIQSLYRIFDIVYRRNVTLKEKHTLETLDSVTGLFNRRYFGQRLDEEISRSRRILLPVSIITVDVDQFHKLNDRVGFRQADAILKMIAAILKKTARSNDILARTGPDEIVLLLPHTPHMGAAVKAERVRRMVESTRFPVLESLGEGSLTVSCGVSEYPSFCNDAEGLIRSADEALLQVGKAGGNKVCLATPPLGFQMDFVPRDLPETGPTPGGRV